ncbi:hypothetical protein [Fibrobacter succinogenes]|uniref:hypothetical protein n=1 Tax=Fibrobacter succinogenes TaxID=833 RepID=UPI0015688C03|nr:hypothetical protein [Fibrobacter succinogenes]
MIKKVILLAAAIVTSSFATWDYFGLLEEGRGSAKAGLYYDWDDDWSQMGLKVGARMTVAPKFELSLQSFGFQFWGEWECDSCEEGGYGLRDLVIGARYALDPELYFFLDFNLPIGREKGKGTPPSRGEISLYFGAQHHKEIQAINGASYGAEAGLFWGFEHDDLERGLELRLGGEFDYKLPSAPLTLLVGTQFWLRLFESEYNDKDLRDDWSDQWKFWVGANFAITQNISVNGSVIVRSQDLNHRKNSEELKLPSIAMEGDAIGFTMDFEFKF